MVDRQTRTVVVFDLNETLLDLSSLDPAFATVFGADQGATARGAWFGQLVELMLTVTVIEAYRPFDQLADEALAMVGAQRGIVMTDAGRRAIGDARKALPVFPDVRPALELLSQSGIRIATLTNSMPATAAQLLERTGVRAFFHDVLSVDAVRRYKPARETYAYAARELGVPLGEIILVAAHSWDVSGALAAGCRAGFVARPGKVMNGRGPNPEFTGADVSVVASRIAASLGR